MRERDEAAAGSDISSIIAQRVMVADGATGSLLDIMLGDELADRRDLVALERPQTCSSVHRAYLASGADILKTATFNASAKGLARFASTGPATSAEPGSAPISITGRSGSELARAVNAASASLARAAADEAEVTDGRHRFVAGSVGPGSDAPSLGSSSYRELLDSYLPQMLGLAEGGVDLVLIETIQDTLQCKAAIGALMSAERATGRRLPFIASATVDERGRMLSGADSAAFAAIVEPFRPVAIGLNCSGGPDELEAAFAAMAAVCSAPLCFMPNAGMPRSIGGAVSWPLDAEAFAEKTASIALRYGAAIVGGCCGTGPDHIAALSRRMASAGIPAARPARVFAVASSFSAIRRGSTASGPGLFVIDERSNASGSVAFKAIVKSGDLDAAARFVIDRAAKEPSAVDVSVAGAAADEVATMAAILRKAAPVATAAVSIDSTDPDVLEAALPLIGGRPIVNSVNLEDEDKAARVFDLAKRFGAAVVCLAMDASGPARDKATKLAIARRLYELALARGLAPEDLLFDCCTFPVAAGDKSLARSAIETFAAVAELQTACPGSISVLGVGNSSFGLPKAQRPAFTSRFMAKAAAAGLGAAIVDPGVLSISVPQAQSDAADALIEAREGVDGYGAAIERLLSFAPVAAEAASAAVTASATVTASGPFAALTAAIAAGDSKSAIAAIRGAAEAGGAPEIAAAIADAMAELGKRYDRGLVALPLVLRSADAARDAFSALRALPRPAPLPEEGARVDERHSGGRVVVLSTVKGDLHDIGKNLVGMVLEAAGFSILDLGTDRSSEDIAQAALEARAIAVGVSGLLTKSLSEMEKVAQALAASASPALLLCGGAAVDKAYVDARIKPLRPGLVAYAKDPFEAISVLQGGSAKSLPGAEPRGPERPEAGQASAYEADSTVAKSPIVEGPAFVPPFLGSRTLERVPFDELVAALDDHAVARSRWGYADAQAGSAAIAQAVAELRAAGGVTGVCRYGYFTARKTSPESIEFHDGADKTASFSFPREPGGERRSVADYYAETDAAAAFCVTLGARATGYLATVRAGGDSAAYVRAHGLLAGLAEAAAEIVHGRLARELAGRGASSAGKRYSFGFPGCPGVEANAELVSLLSAGDIGVRTTDGYQLDPEFSVTALLVPRAAARYIDA